MSKYVRTTQGVFKVIDERVFCGTKTYYTGEHIINESVVINQADTIKELVDEYVIIRDSTKTNQLVRADDIKYLKELIKEDKRIIEIKGAIWTDKGLIYVAKLNKEGDLELI